MTKKVLIVDDEKNIAISIQFLMRREGFEVLVAHDGEEGLEKIRTERPDLVLLDWNLPGRGGPAALEGLRAARHGLAVIALSGRPEARRAALAAGADAFVSKGDPPERLLATLQTVLRIAPRGTGARRRPSGTTVPVYNL